MSANTPLLRASVVLQLLLLLGVAWVFHLESQGFRHLLLIATAGYVVFSLVPTRWRLTSFAGISLLGYCVVLGPLETLLLLGLGGAIWWLVRLPSRWQARLTMAVGLLGALLLIRSGRLPFGLSIPLAVWPIFGAMFMFRLPVFLQDLRHHPDIARKPSTLAYFFLLPNVCFPLFPVIDSKRFRLGARPEAPPELAQKGIVWMARGVSHLLLYRLVYHHLTIDPAEVDGSLCLLRYMLASFFLYLRVSGQFHLIIGLLLVFGFDLPRTHRNYFLASSLGDFWRRINIYWKDFMAQSFFFPCHDRLRRIRHLGPRAPVAIATAWVFFCTWALHAYQWAWLTGRWTWSWNDAVFWGILGLLVIGDQLREGGGTPRSGRLTATRPRIAHGLRVGRTFLLLTVLWSLWSTESIGQWLDLWRRAPNLAPVLLAVFIGLSTAVAWLERGPATPPARVARPVRLTTARRPVPVSLQGAGVIVGLLALVALGQPRVYGLLGPTAARWVESLSSARLSSVDARALERGYYEQLIAVGQLNPGLREAYTGRPADWLRIDQVDAWRARQDLRIGELVPGARIEFKGASLGVNEHGLRDRDHTYSRTKPPNTFRVIFLGSSHTMGSGVGDRETFENLFEDLFKGQLPATGSRMRLESLNFALAGHSVVEDLVVLEQRALAFGPDAVVLVGHTHDLHKLGRYLARILHQGRAIPYPQLDQRLADLDRADPPRVLEQRLRSRLPELLSWVYGRIASSSRSAGAEPYWVFLPLLEGETPEEIDLLVTAAGSAGFWTFDLRQVYAGRRAANLRLAPWDYHPNARAHRLIAERLDQTLGRDIRRRFWQDSEGSEHPR